MKKRGLVILALSAALTAGAAITSMAAGWASENGRWVYYDDNNYAVVNEWRKGADNQWRYLNEYGEMAINSWVDDCYYVDANGIMVAGKWLQLDYNGGGSTEEPEWYYFNDNGKSVRDTWKKINGRWYHFDSEGAMETGWVDGDMYYAGSDGAALVGWHKLLPPESDYEDIDPFDEEEGKKWYYFNSSGKKYVPTGDSANGYAEKRIDGTYYCFDSTGAMQTGWVQFGDDGEVGDDITSYRYYGSDGKAVTGWYSAEPPTDINGYDNEVEWFYFAKNGVPKVGPEEGEAKVSDLTKISNKTYLFNSLGNPVYGLQRVYLDSSEDEYTSYYFDANSRTVVRGKKEVEEGDGDVSSFLFLENGRGYTGVKNGYLYYMGKLQKAEEGMRYEAIYIPDGSTYLVSTSGKVTRSTTGVKDADGVKYKTDANGVVKTVDDLNVYNSEYGRAAKEPYWY